jgi:hypothetical protein
MPSTQSSTKDETSRLIYLAQYEYLDEPGAVWPAQAFEDRRLAEQWATMSTGGNRVYTVIPLQLKAGKAPGKVTALAGQLALF